MGLDDPLTLEGRDLAVTMRETDVFLAATSPEGRKRSPLPGEVEQGLIESGTRVAVATRLLADARHDNAAWRAKAADAGMTVIEVARLSGISRRAEYDRRSG